MSPDGITDNELLELRQYVLGLFGFRCVRCHRPNVHQIHEIVPKSIRPTDWYELSNMVPLCSECHDYIHTKGSQNFVDELESLRRMALDISQA